MYYKNIINSLKETLKFKDIPKSKYNFMMRIIIKIKEIIYRLSKNFRKIPLNIAFRIYERLFTFKNNIKSVTTYNYGTINLEKEKKSLNKLNKLGDLFLNILNRLDRLTIASFKIKLSQLDLIILNQKYKSSIEDCINLMQIYPEYIEQLMTRFLYLLKRTNFRHDKKIVEPFIQIDGFNEGIIFLIDSYHLKTPGLLYYSLISKFNNNKILGLTVEESDITEMKNLASDYKIINLHLSYVFKLEKELFEKKILQFCKLSRLGYKLNIFIHEYSEIKSNLNNKTFKKLINHSEYIYVHNQKIKDEISLNLKLPINKILVIDIINYQSLIKKNNPNILINNLRLEPTNNFTLHINSLSDINNFNFLKSLIEDYSNGQILNKKDEKLIIVLDPNANNPEFLDRSKRIKDLIIKSRRNIILLKHTTFGFFGQYTYYEIFKLANNYIAINNIFHYEYRVLIDTLNITAFVDNKIFLDFDSLNNQNLHNFKNYIDLKKQLLNNNNLINKDLRQDKSFFNAKHTQKIIDKFLFSKKLHSNPNYQIKKNDSHDYEFIILRIIGNDLPPLHDKEQSINNITYILQNEVIEDNSLRVWILNRIISKSKLIKIKNLLDQNNEKYYEIEFIPQDFIKQSFSDFDGSNFIFQNSKAYYNLEKGLKNKLLNLIIKNHNKYLMNNNGARNFALQLGKKLKGKWIFPLDGNIYIDPKNWSEICKDSKKEGFNYMFLPMARVSNKSDLEKNKNLYFNEEPQIAFKFDSQLSFDEKYVYGSRPKIELLQRLLIIDLWGSIRANIPNYLYGFKDRTRHFYDYKFSSGVIRLPPNMSNSFTEDSKINLNKRALNRDVAIFSFIKNTLLETGKVTKKESDSMFFNLNKLNSQTVKSSELETILNKQFVSVLDKIPPKDISNYIDMHDYVSFAPYWWPNESTNSGLPYVRKDGYWRNECTLYSKESITNDRSALQLLIDRLTTLSIGYKVHKDPDLLNYISGQISHWFINDETKMNPNLKFSQTRRGIAKEHNSGVIDFKDIFYLLSSIKIINQELQEKKDFYYEGFKYWLTEYKYWLLNSEMAQKESCTPNNHATCYLLQLASIEAFLDNKNDLFKTYIQTNIHLIQQISNDGKQPRELNRTLSKHYVTFNLQQFLNLNLIFKNSLNLSYFDNDSKDNKLIKAIIWLYESRNQWEYEQINHFDNIRLDVLFHIAKNSSSILNEYIPNNALIPISELPSKFEQGAGIPLFWKETLT